MLYKTLIKETLNQMGKYFTEVSEQSRMPVFQRAPEKLHVTIPKGKPFVDETNKIPRNKAEEASEPIVITKKEEALDTSAIRLQEALIWSEILGKPMCKRRRDRNRFV